jgi:predicted RNase H-like HicB family nuclease
MKDLLFRKVLQEKFDMKYKVNLKKTEEGYAVWVPGLPGCWSQGKSEDEALENIKDAIEAYLNVVDSLTADKATRYVEIANA